MRVRTVIIVIAMFFAVSFSLSSKIKIIFWIFKSNEEMIFLYIIIILRYTLYLQLPGH